MVCKHLVMADDGMTTGRRQMSRINHLNLSEKVYNHTVDVVVYGDLNPDLFRQYDDHQLKAFLEMRYHSDFPVSCCVNSLWKLCSACWSPQADHTDPASEPTNKSTTKPHTINDSGIACELSVSDQDHHKSQTKCEGIAFQSSSHSESEDESQSELDYERNFDCSSDEEYECDFDDSSDESGSDTDSEPLVSKTGPWWRSPQMKMKHK